MLIPDIVGLNAVLGTSTEKPVVCCPRLARPSKGRFELLFSKNEGLMTFFSGNFPNFPPSLKFRRPAKGRDGGGGGGGGGIITGYVILFFSLFFSRRVVMGEGA